jgi:hypothetical protein
MKKNIFIKLLEEIGITQDSVSELALETKLIIRQRQLTAIDLLYSFCNESMYGSVSYNDIASHIESECNISVSKQSICKKITEKFYLFFEKILAQTITEKLKNEKNNSNRVFCHFNRILVQDSTIIKLPTKLFALFSGVSNQSTNVCNARIQGTYDILNEQFISFSIDSYSKNDLAAAPELNLQENDLTLRDRGYLINDEIQRHIETKAHCIYRYKFNMMLLDPTTEEPIDLLKKLEKNSFVDMEVKLNNKSKTKVRIVAFPVNNSNIVNQRKRKAKQEKKAPPSEKYLEMLSWTIFITTIPNELADFKELLLLYGLRWRIEIIFKSWKSNLSFAEVHNVSYTQLKVILISRFIMILICTQFLFAPCRQIIKRDLNKDLSLLKFIRYITKNSQKIIHIVSELVNNCSSQNLHLKVLARYCSYEKRNKRINYEQIMNYLFA